MSGYQIRRENTYELSMDEIIGIVCKFYKQYPNIIKIITTRLDQNLPICCPFTTGCNAFPCETLHCNADVCSNGYAYRMS